MTSTSRILFASAAFAALAIAHPALSQPAVAPVRAAVGELEEVVVTATRSNDTVNRVALSISAQTQRAMDQQGIRTIGDLTAAVPAMAVSQTVPGVAQISIRGIQNNAAGAATTGFYLDDTPLTKRGALGCCTNNGSPLPPLFDLERVEVLRGPQGTLFGSGSQGGTVRYITPAPSLTRRSVYSRAEASTTADGDPSWELGAAVGGPIIEDKLGFRISANKKHTGGWLDYLNRVTLAKGEQDANFGDAKAGRLAVTFAPFENTNITLAYFHSMDKWHSRQSSYSLDTLGPITEEAGCYSNTGALIACTAPNVNYRRGPLTLPQLSGLGEETSIDAGAYPSKTTIDVYTLTLDQDWDRVNLKSITSLIEDSTILVSQSATGTQNRIRGTRQTYNGFTFLGQGAYAGLPDLPPFMTGGFNTVANRRSGLTQEFRLSSTGDPKPISWVAGVYYSNQRNTQNYDLIYPNFDVLIRSLIGISALQRYGVPMYNYGGDLSGWSAKYQTMKDTEIAAFGEANYWLTDKLKFNFGIRLSRLSLDYFEVHYGPASNGNNPAAIPGGVTGPDNSAESVISPKFGVQYQLSENDMIYGTVSKGFRAGGVNAAVPETLCASTLARYNATTDSIPKTYDSDTVWSYEGGAKMRVFDNRVQVNGALYRIDWKDLQTNVTIPTPCVGNFIGNAGKARSQGFELELTGRIFEGLIGNFAVGYTDAQYIGDSFGLGAAGATNLVIAYDGQNIAVPPWTVQVGLRYERDIGDDLRAYARADYRWIKGVTNTAVQKFGLTAYSPTAVFPDTEGPNIRLGVERGPLDVNVFVNNLFDSRKGEIAGGLTACPATGNAQCLTGFYNPYYTVTPASWPRQIGMQIAYRY